MPRNAYNGMAGTLALERGHSANDYLLCEAFQFWCASSKGLIEKALPRICHFNDQLKRRVKMRRKISVGSFVCVMAGFFIAAWAADTLAKDKIIIGQAVSLSGPIRNGALRLWR